MGTHDRDGITAAQDEEEENRSSREEKNQKYWLTEQALTDSEFEAVTVLLCILSSHYNSTWLAVSSVMLVGSFIHNSNTLQYPHVGIMLIMNGHWTDL